MPFAATINREFSLSRKVEGSRSHPRWVALNREVRMRLLEPLNSSVCHQRVGKVKLLEWKLHEVFKSSVANTRVIQDKNSQVIKAFQMLETGIGYFGTAERQLFDSRQPLDMGQRGVGGWGGVEIELLELRLAFQVFQAGSRDLRPAKVESSQFGQSSQVL